MNLNILILNSEKRINKKRPKKEKNKNRRYRVKALIGKINKRKHPICGYTHILTDVCTYVNKRRMKKSAIRLL